MCERLGKGKEKLPESKEGNLDRRNTEERSVQFVYSSIKHAEIE